MCVNFLFQNTEDLLCTSKYPAYSTCVTNIQFPSQYNRNCNFDFNENKEREKDAMGAISWYCRQMLQRMRTEFPTC